MPNAAAPIAIKVTHKMVFESHPLLNSPIIFSLEAILRIKNRSGTAATPFKTAA